MLIFPVVETIEMGRRGFKGEKIAFKEISDDNNMSKECGAKHLPQTK